MSDQPYQNQTSSDEVDLSLIFDKIKSFFKSILLGVVMIFRFFWNYKIRLLILIIIGMAIHFILITKNDRIYINEFLVKTNYGSTEYLYSKINTINVKLESKDTIYLESIFGKDFAKVDELKVIPVVDIYSLVNNSSENRETFKLLLNEYGNISFLEEEINVNQYSDHKIRIYIKGNLNNKIITTNLYNFLSSNSYFNDLKLVALESYKEQLEQNKIIRDQIDSIIETQKDSGLISRFNDNAISFEGSQNLNELLNQKQDLLTKDMILRNKLSSNDEVLKTMDSSFSVLSKECKLKYWIYPVLVLSLYCAFFYLIFI